MMFTMIFSWSMFSWSRFRTARIACGAITCAAALELPFADGAYALAGAYAWVVSAS